MNRPRLVTGAKVLVYVNGKLFGRCAGFSWTSSTPRRKIRVIDIPFPVELAATTVEVTWTMNVLRTIGDGGMQGAGVIAPPTQVISEKYFTLQLVERSTGLTLFKSDLNETDGENWQILPKMIMQGQVQGSGIVWVNEAPGS